MLLSAVSVLVVAQSSSEIPEVLMNNPVHRSLDKKVFYVFELILKPHNYSNADKSLARPD